MQLVPLALSLVAGCSSRPVALEGGATVGDTAAASGTGTDGAPTWSSGVAEVFREHCVRCHAKDHFSTYAPLQTYEQVLARRSNIEQKIVSPPGWGAQMPPWPGGEIPSRCEPPARHTNDLRMTAEEIDLVLGWLAAGAPEGGPRPAEPLVATPPARLDGATSYPFAEGYVMRIDEDDDDGHRDDWVCVVVDPGAVPETRLLGGIALEPDVVQIVRGAVVLLDERRESERFLAADGPRRHGASWYDCDEGFGFEGRILAGFLPEGEPLELPPGAAVEVPGDAWLVYRLHYHAHYDHADPEDTSPLPPVLEWPDATGLALRWVDPAEVEARALMLTFGNVDGPVVDGTGNLTAPFEVPPGSEGFETMVTTVPGEATDRYLVWAVQPELGAKGRTVVVSTQRRGGEEVCLGANPRWDPSWQVPLTFDPGEAPTVSGGDRLRVDCEYRNDAPEALTLDRESCRAMVGLLPL